MNKALYFSAAIAMALSAATAQSAQYVPSACHSLSGPARAACMQSSTRSDGVDAATVGRAIGHGTARPRGGLEPGNPVISADAPSSSANTGIDAAVGATTGGAAQAEGGANLRSAPEITHGGPNAQGAAPK